ncbi:MAG: CDP-alcohol phosphatidyltransferase family protein [Thermoplasmata archaeon]|nr:CDP-alcohol phosphatidyltransferase family protein [Thermoplasmata archaeon]
MVVEGYRGRAAPYLARLANPFLSWDPARISALSLLASVGAGVLALLARWEGPLLFLPVAVLIFTGGVFDALDGEVARRTKRASLRGDFLDHVYDRYADVAILLGLAASGFVNPVLTLLGLVSLLLVSYLGTQAQAVGGGRAYGGLLGRADRLLLLTAVTFLEFDLSLPWPWASTAPLERIQLAGVGFTVIDLAMVYFLVAGQLTVLLRARGIYAGLPPAPDLLPPDVPSGGESSTGLPPRIR